MHCCAVLRGAARSVLGRAALQTRPPRTLSQIRCAASTPLSDAAVTERKAKIKASWVVATEGYIEDFMAGKVDFKRQMYPLTAKEATRFLEGIEAPRVLDIAAAGGEPTMTLRELLGNAKASFTATDYCPTMVRTRENARTRVCQCCTRCFT